VHEQQVYNDKKKFMQAQHANMVMFNKRLGIIRRAIINGKRKKINGLGEKRP